VGASGVDVVNAKAAVLGIGIAVGVLSTFMQFVGDAVVQRLRTV